MTLPERYEGKPVLLIIENYVLSLLGELDENRTASMHQIVGQMWGESDDWMGTVREALGLVDAVDDAIRQNWEGFQKAATEQEKGASPFEFAMLFADALEREAPKES